MFIVCGNTVCVYTYANSPTIAFTRTLNKGDEVTDCYGAHYLNSPTGRLERRKNLKKWFKFQCHCEACDTDYPPSNRLPKKIDDKLGLRLKELFDEFMKEVR